MSQLDCRDQLFGFLTLVAHQRPERVKRDEPQFDYTLLSHWLGGELAVALLNALNALRLELVPRHADDSHLITAFWELFHEVSSQPEKFCRDAVLYNLIDAFGVEWKKPLQEFDIVYSIDYLSLGSETIELNDVQFFTPTEDKLVEHSIAKTEIASWAKVEGAMTLAITRVEAVASGLAFESGRIRVLEAIALLRLAALRGLSGRTLSDELLQWELAGKYLVRQVNPPLGEWLWGFHRPFGPLVVELGSDITKGIEASGSDKLSRDGLPQAVRQRVLRAIQWVAHSTVHESDDHKFVDLCTALEILLLPEERYEPRKGSTIALRYSLLGGTLNPPAVKWMYDRRNDIIHGEPLPIVGPRDTWDLRMVCYTTITLIIHASAINQQLQSLQEVIGLFETKDNLQHFIRLCERGMYQGNSTKELVRTAVAKLKTIGQ